MIRPAPTQRDTCLVLMLKAPQHSKRRLAERIGKLATGAARHLCDCALEDMADWPGTVCFAPAGTSGERWLNGRLADPSLLVRQSGVNLGERINHVSRALTTRGLSDQIFIGTDCPQLDSSYLCGAAHALRRHDAVLGPASDGGVVLMGTRRPWPDLSGLPWSTAALCEALERLCRRAQWTVAILEPRADVDTVQDLLAARGALAGDARPARRALLRWLAEQYRQLALSR